MWQYYILAQSIIIFPDYQLILMIRLITKIKIPRPTIFYHKPSSSFVLMKMFQKRFKEKQEKQRANPETYTAQSTQQQKKQLKQEEEQIYQASYDFFSRQKQIELNKDFRKIKQQSTFIPSDVGKGGFDEIVYWSQFAKTPQQINDLIKAFNRVKIPDQINDKFRFQEFGNKVMEAVYLSSDYATLQEFATFGQKYTIDQPIYWKKIEEKAVRINPKTPQQIKDCIEIAFIMSKLNQGDIIFSSLASLFKDLEITVEDTAKLLIAYSNKEQGTRQWIQLLMKNLMSNICSLKKQVLAQTLVVFKKLKLLPDKEEKKVIEQIQKHIPDFTFKQLCYVAGFVGHGKKQKEFWQKIQKRALEVVPKRQTFQTIIYLLQFLTCYSISTEFIRQKLIIPLRQNKYKILHSLPPQILSEISKTLFIYELQNQTKDIEEVIQMRIIKVFNQLSNVEVEDLVKVIKNYTVTRIGSRELYIFLEQVADAMFPQLSKHRDQLELLCTLYEKSELCTPQFLERLTNSI